MAILRVLLFLALVSLDAGQAWGQPENMPLTGALQVRVTSKYGGGTTTVTSPISTTLRLLADGKAEFGSGLWPSLTLTTNEGRTGKEPDLITVRLKEVGTGVYRMIYIDWSRPAHTQYHVSFPLTLEFDFAKNPFIGNKDQDCKISLQSLETGSDGLFSASGACELQTYSFPSDWRYYVVGIFLDGQVKAPTWRNIVMVPDVGQMYLFDALSVMQSAGLVPQVELRQSGAGATVVGQTPYRGTAVPAGSIVSLFF